MKKNHKPKLWRILIPVLAATVLLAAGAVYYFWNRSQVATVQAQTTATTAKTAQVKTGDITLSISGTGTLIAGKETALRFSASGTVASVEVQVGDKVTAGQVLANLSSEDIETLQSVVTTALQNLDTAQTAVDTLRENSAANLANAQLTLATAKKALTDAKSSLVQKGVARCDQESIDIYYQKYLLQQAELEKLEKADDSQDYYLNTIVPQKNKVTQAYNTYIWCTGFTEYEIDSSHANLTLAQITFDQAQTALDELEANNGIDPVELAKAENAAANAKLTLENNQKVLAGATITAPYDGTILTVAGSAGNAVDTATFITIADLVHPRIEFIIDETDLGSLALNQDVMVSFDAIADRTFKGKVTRIDPTLTTVNNYQAVKGMIDLDLSNETDLPLMPSGLQASVEIISGQANEAVLVPIEALRDLGEGSFSVFVVGQDGQMKLRVVTIGLMDATYAEVLSGLKAGETVSTGITEVK
jgi:RND family efflux transporter MFP subunit